MSNKTAILTEKFGRLVVKETKIPVPSKDQLLVKVLAASVNPIDYKIQVSGRFFEDFPRVLGQDVAGVVEAVGPDQKRFKKGDKVFSFVPTFGQPPNTEFGGFQQYTLTGDITTGLIPSNTSFDSAATLPLALATAADGLYGFLGLSEPSKATQTGEWVLIWGGASSVGQVAIQLAVASGYKVIVTASPASHQDLKKLGATTVVDYHDDDVVQQILKATDGKLKAVYDSIASDKSVPATIAVLPHGGKAAYTQMTPDALKLDCPSNVAYERVMAAHLFGQNKDLGRNIFDWASTALENGTLVGNPVKLCSGGIDSVQETLDYYRENGINYGKYVLHPED